ncbi:hypothetical protein TIFTF001_011002 [Ficus carica]|uniref:Uncharacterized protein n=1 Tax=Ficus carica TaxID=3494 RepID=A0AA88D4Z5_FICCA|nr:hypothetical protein TIFTF001_011002 [Ficus carica]
MADASPHGDKWREPIRSSQELGRVASLDWLELAGAHGVVEHKAQDPTMPLVAKMRSETLRTGRVRCTRQSGPPPGRSDDQKGRVTARGLNFLLLF